MRVIHRKKSTIGGSLASMYGKGLKTIHSFRRTMGNGITSAVFDESLGQMKPSRVLQNVRVKRSYQPKKYITFE
jgi:hypothetical protein